MKMPWIKNTDGRPDAVLTFALFSVATVLMKMLFAGLTIKYKEFFTYTVMAPDAATIGAVFLPTLGAYVSNKYVNLNFHPDYLRMKKDIDGDGKEEEVFVPKTDGK